MLKYLKYRTIRKTFYDNIKADIIRKFSMNLINLAATKVTASSKNKDTPIVEAVPRPEVLHKLVRMLS